ncbi:hypothetical protein PsYK624_021890 [Phanerochaete sordida]|uniref:Protein CPL1-like domain-containing protein n=1 Tax=Phanerochaete sordida TaxID=48140 RepID=A0A9P3L939_9APHY|nr:hypothetical protein PsYK624_021890 [Phanerochaete sordida]
MARLSSALLFAAAALPYVFATNDNCSSGEFFFQQKSCCLKQGGTPNPPPAPSGVSCPTNGWQWHDTYECCVPHQPQTSSSPPPQCQDDCFWHDLDLKCYPNGATPSPPAPTKPSTPSAPATPVTPSAPATPSSSSDCGSNNFFFQDKSCCLPHGGQPNPPSPPSGVSCPTNGWYWSDNHTACVPSQPQTPSSPAPSCNPDCFWSSLDLKCYPHGSSSTPSAPSQPTKPSVPSAPATPVTPTAPANPTSSSDCGNNNFFFQDKSCCLPHGGQPNPPSPPSGVTCPTNGWYWSNEHTACVPSQPQTPSSPAPSCNPDCFWSSLDLKCYPHGSSSTPSTPSQPTKPSTPSAPATPTGPSDCSSSDFWFPTKECCLPHGGQPNPPSPPSGTSCPPSSWYWHTGKQCCVPSQPTTPSSPPPQCQNGWTWNGSDLKCYPQPPTAPSNPPKPSGLAGHKRHAKSRAVTLCPSPLSACPIKGLMSSSGDYECLDTTADLTSCGGCASTGAGQDCTEIPSAVNVACTKGACVVSSCAKGFKVAKDAKSCVSA